MTLCLRYAALLFGIFTPAACTRLGPIPCHDSSTCPTVAPLCHPDRQVCVVCSDSALNLTLAQRDAMCGDRTQALGKASPAAAHCGMGPEYDTFGLCLECSVSSDCNSGSACWRGSCVPACTQTGDCPSQVCERFDPAEPRGACVPQEEVWLVDRTLECSQAADGRTAATAFCSLDAAFTQIAAKAPTAALSAQDAPPSRRAVLRLLTGGPYGSLRPPPPQGWTAINTFMVFGPESQTHAQLGHDAETGETLVGVWARPGVQIYLDSVDVIDAQLGVLCVGAEPSVSSSQGPTSAVPQSLVSLRRVDVRRAAGVAVEATNCDLHLDQVQLRENHDGALALWEQTTYQISNTFIVSNNSNLNPIVYLDTASSGRFQFNTVASNLLGPSPAVYCGPDLGQKKLEDSVFAYNSVLDNTAQVQGRCGLDTSVVSDRMSGGTMGAPEFVSAVAQDGDFHLKPGSAANQACCIDKIAPRQDLPLRDFDDNARPQGKALDIGAGEVRN